MKNNKMTKDTVPEGFSVVMALVDLIPVVFFGLSTVRVGRLFQSALFVTGALICLLSGVVKVLWKLIAAVSRRNIWLSSAAGGADRGPREAVQRGDSDRDLRLSGVCVLRAGRAGDGLHVRLCAAARFERPARELARAGRQRSGADLHLYRPAAGVNQSLCVALDKLMPYITISYFFGAAAPCYNKKLDKTSPLEKECYTT